MKVAILTSFTNFDRAYSLVGVALEQAAMLAENGVDFSFFTHVTGGPALEEMQREEWLLPHLRPEMPKGKVEEDVINEPLRERLRDWLRDTLKDYDVVLSHDLLFQSWFVTHNQAIRDVVDELPCGWAHWVHSAPASGHPRAEYPATLRYEPMQKSLYVYLNEADRLRYAESIGVDLKRVMVCYNPMDMGSFLGVDPALARFIRQNELDDFDLMQVYPFSMPRWKEKGLKSVLAIFGAWKKQGYKVKLVLVNSHCNHPSQVAQKQSVAEMAAAEFNLGPKDLVWTSDNPDWWAYKKDGQPVGAISVPNTVVRKLFQLSNVFIFPSQSEVCSRVLQEASLAGCLVLGNSSFLPMHEFLDPVVPKHQFGKLGETVTYHTGFNQWHSEVARATAPFLSHPMLRQKSHMMRLSSRSWIWRNQMLAILEAAKGVARV